VNSRINNNVEFRNLGLIDYKEGWDYQTSLFDSIVELKIANRSLSPEEQKVTPNYLLFCEHPHVYTLGKSGDPANLLADSATLAANQATFYKINRGGDITYHGPGQIVGYPIIDLENFFTDIHKYMRFMEEAIIRTLLNYDIAGERAEGLTGVWIEAGTPKARKICAMGVKTSRWVTMHGFALNVNTDLNYFNNIVPCGISDKAVTSIEKELGRKVDPQEVAELLKGHFGEVFGMEFHSMSQ